MDPATDPYIDLNPPQRQAVTHPAGPLLILAGAGSGKTRVITQRLAELVLRRGVPAGRVLAVTFTNKAARELRARAAQLLGDAVRGLWIGTFHAIGARLLRRFGARLGLPRDFSVLDDSDQLVLLGQVARELYGAAVPPAGEPRALQAAIDQARNEGLSPQDLLQGDPLLARAYALYEGRLRQQGAVDFGDLLLLPLRLCREHAEVREAFAGLFDQVLVDEFQDVNHAQSRLLHALCDRSRQLMVVGDDDQAIYGWRGAQVGIILNFHQEWPDAAVVRLEENYRSTQLILDAANGLIRRNRSRHDKTLFSARKGGAAIVLYTARDERREAEFVLRTIRQLMQDEGRAPDDFAVLYRVNAQARPLEEALRDAGLPYCLVGGTRFYDRAEIKDLHGYLRVIHNTADDVALRRIINTPPRGIGEATLEKLAALAAQGQRPLWQVFCDALQREGGPLDAGQRARGQELRALIEALRGTAPGGLRALVEGVLAGTGYLTHLGEGREGDARRAHVQELLEHLDGQRAADGGPGALSAYLEQAALVSAADEGGRGVSLLTVHAAKGLEFPVVFVTGLEERLFPSLRRDEDPDSDPTAARGKADEGVEEERRLCYVALTRARERLYLCHARERRLYGDSAWECQASRFLDEIPPACLTRQAEPVDAPWAKAAAAPVAAAKDGFQVGQRVSHPTFGEGEVRSVSGSGAQLKLAVYFASVGPKTLLARFVTALAAGGASS